MMEKRTCWAQWLDDRMSNNWLFSVESADDSTPWQEPLRLRASPNYYYRDASVISDRIGCQVGAKRDGGGGVGGVGESLFPRFDEPTTS